MCLCMYPRPARPASAVSSYNEALRGGVVVAVCTRHYLYIGSYFDSRVSAPRPPLKQRTKCSTVEQRRKGGRALRRGRRWRRRGRRAAAAARGRGGRVALRASRARLPFARGLAIGSAVELCGAEAAALTVWGLSVRVTAVLVPVGMTRRGLVPRRRRRRRRRGRWRRRRRRRRRRRGRGRWRLCRPHRRWPRHGNDVRLFHGARLARAPRHRPDPAVAAVHALTRGPHEGARAAACDPDFPRAVLGLGDAPPAHASVGGRLHCEIARAAVRHAPFQVHPGAARSQRVALGAAGAHLVDAPFEAHGLLPVDLLGLPGRRLRTDEADVSVALLAAIARVVPKLEVLRRRLARAQGRRRLPRAVPEERGDSMAAVRVGRGGVGRHENGARPMCAERETLPFRRVRLFSPLCPSREDSNRRIAILGGISQSTAQPDGFRPRLRF